MTVTNPAGCFSYSDYYPRCHLRVTSAHPLATPQQSQPYVCLWKALCSGALCILAEVPTLAWL